MENSDPSLTLIEPNVMRGVEIGPLHHPKVRKCDGDVWYADFYSTNELRERYLKNATTRPHLDEIEDVDYVIKEQDSLWDVIGADGPFDYVVAAHVIEHIANPLGWFQGLERVLTDEDLSLVIPDRRFSFDVNRLETRQQDWV